MALRIKGKLEVIPEIAFDEDINSVRVLIDDNNVADFNKDGEFVFWGKGSKRQYKGWWDR